MKPKFKKGQVVQIDTDWYKKEMKNERFQKVTFIFPWMTKTVTSTGNTKVGKQNKFGYCLSNGDECHEKFLKPLTKKEIG